MEILFSLFWALVFVIACLKKHVKYLSGIPFVIFIAMLMVFNTSNPDYDTFELIYNNINNLEGLDHGNDLLFLVTNYLGHFLGLQFKEFRCTYISLCLLSYFCFIKKHTKHVNITLLCYLVTGGLFDYIQLRQFGALAISIWIVDVAMNENQNKRLFKAIVLLICAVGFHKSALLYLIIFPYFFIDQRYQKRIYGIAFLAFVTIIFVGLRSTVIYELMSRFAGEGTASYYLISKHYVDTVPKIIFDIVVQQGMLIYILFVRYKDCSQNNSIKQKMMAILAIDTLITILMPLNILSIQFKRVARLTLIPSFSMILNAKAAKNKMIVRKKDVIIMFLLLVYVIAYCQITLTANPIIMSDLFDYFNVS